MRRLQLCKLVIMLMYLTSKENLRNVPINSSFVSQSPVFSTNPFSPQSLMSSDNVQNVKTLLLLTVETLVYQIEKRYK